MDVKMYFKKCHAVGRLYFRSQKFIRILKTPVMFIEKENGEEVNGKPEKIIFQWHMKIVIIFSFRFYSFED